MAQAKNLIGKENLIIHLRKYPEAVHKALQTITQTTIDFIEELKKTGVDGIFYAIQHAQYGLLSTTEFEEFQKPYDLQVLQAVKPCWLNMAHIHGEPVMFDRVAAYPVQILNWHDQSTQPTLAEAQKFFPGIVCGGLSQWSTMVLGTPQQVQKEAHKAILATGGKRMILGTGCVLPVTAPHGNILAVCNSVKEEI